MGKGLTLKDAGCWTRQDVSCDLPVKTLLMETSQCAWVQGGRRIQPMGWE